MNVFLDRACVVGLALLCRQIHGEIGSNNFDGSHGRDRKNRSGRKDGQQNQCDERISECDPAMKLWSEETTGLWHERFSVR
jgi:hypothetical protein